MVDELHQTLCQFLKETSAPILDLSGVDHCDVAALQLLFSARKAATVSGKCIELRLSDAVSTFGSALGLSISEQTSERAAGTVDAAEGAGGDLGAL